MDVVQNVIVEMRPRLCSCNVVIVTHHGFAEKYHLKVSIRPNYIVINYTDFQAKKKKNPPKKRKNSRRDSSSSYESYSDSEEESFSYSKFINISSHCKLVPSSLSSLKTEDDFISFRILTEPIGSNSSGTYYNEVIRNPMNTLPTEGLKNYCSFEKSTIALKEAIKIRMQCSNCSNELFCTKNPEVVGEPVLSFNRILELPSDNMDVSDWFCHKHDNVNDNNDDCKGISDKTALNPSERDVFYGPRYFTMNTSNIKQSLVRQNKKIIHCERCFSWLGIKMGDSCKFWNSCIRFADYESPTNFRFFSETVGPRCGNVALEDFLHLIQYAVQGSAFDTMASTHKMIFECKISEGKSKNILIWIMDRRLDVLKMKQQDKNAPNENQNEIKLERFITSKLLYRIDERTDVLESWMKDCAVQTFEISKDMFLEGSKHLNAMSNYIPGSFKKTNDFFVSYLNI